MSTEYLLAPENKRYNLFPIIHQDLYNFYVIHRSTFWIPEEVSLTKDLHDWNYKLNDKEREFIKLVIAFFVTSDMIVNEQLAIDVDDITVLEYKLFLDNKIDRENIHTIMYSRLLNVYITDDTERERLFRGIDTIPTISNKVKWFRKYHNRSFSHRIVSCAITEGIFFSGSFCSIYWLKKRGLMPGLCDSNELIAREEGMHYEVACYVYEHYVINKLSNEEIKQMIIDAVEIEIEFIKYILPDDLIGINSKVMSQYIQYVADRLSIKLINSKIYDVKLPFEWMSLIAQNTKTDFFAHRPTQYSKYVSEEKIKLVDDY
jgi:ribonucleoside-diphosphate reductase beta chain